MGRLLSVLLLMFFATHAAWAGANAHAYLAHSALDANGLPSVQHAPRAPLAERVSAPGAQSLAISDAAHGCHSCCHPLILTPDLGEHLVLPNVHAPLPAWQRPAMAPGGRPERPQWSRATPPPSLA